MIDLENRDGVLRQIARGDRARKRDAAEHGDP